MPPIRGFNPAAIGKSATLAIDDDAAPISLDVFPMQNNMLFIALPGPEQAKRIARITPNQRANLFLRFQMAGQSGFFLTTLMDPAGPVASVLSACGISVPTPPPVVFTATPSMKKYTFMGINLGMTVQQATAAEKAIATTPIKPGPGGGMDFETAQFYFISVTPDDNGVINFYKVCGKTSRAVKSGIRSGPLYEKAVKAFGPATGKSSVPQIVVQWDKSGGVDARYEWDGDEEPGGCLFVTRAQ